MSKCISVAASMLLTASFLAVGIAFFSPYWLSNVGIQPVFDQEMNITGGVPYIPHIVPSYVSVYPDRGLWAQCGIECIWFWENGYALQRTLLTPLKWPLATQVLYFVAATLILFSELFARLQQCCRPRKVVYLVLGIVLLVSALIQVAAVATFGGGASRWPYNAISDPRKFTQYLGQPTYFLYLTSTGTQTFDFVYLGWSYWMAVVGAILTVISGCLFIVTSCTSGNGKDYI